MSFEKSDTARILPFSMTKARSAILTVGKRCKETQRRRPRALRCRLVGAEGLDYVDAGRAGCWEDGGDHRGG